MIFEVEQHSHSFGSLLVLKGRLDSLAGVEFESTLLNLLDESEQGLILDFEQVDYIASAGLRIILMAVKRAKSSKKKLILAQMQSQIKHVFEISGFLKIMTVVDTLDQAKEIV